MRIALSVLLGFGWLASALWLYRLRRANRELRQQIWDMMRGWRVVAEPIESEGHPEAPEIKGAPDILAEGVRRAGEELAARKGMRSPWAI